MRIDLDALQEVLDRAAMPVLEYVMFDGYNAAMVVKWSNGVIRPIKGSMNLEFEWDDTLPKRYEITPRSWVVMEVIDGKRARVVDVLEIDNDCDGLYYLDHQLAEWRGLGES